MKNSCENNLSTYKTNDYLLKPPGLVSEHVKLTDDYIEIINDTDKTTQNDEWVDYDNLYDCCESLFSFL